MRFTALIVVRRAMKARPTPHMAGHEGPPYMTGHEGPPYMAGHEGSPCTRRAPLYGAPDAIRPLSRS